MGIEKTAIAINRAMYGEQKANAAKTELQKAGVDTSGLSYSALLDQYYDGYSMIADRNSQTASEYFQKGGTGKESGSFLSKGSSILSGFMPLKKKTLLGGYLGSNAVLGG